MLPGRIDRNAWADEIEALVVRFDPGPSGKGNKSAFARRIGMTRKTLERWAARNNDISPESVRAVAERLRLTDREQMELLTRVGYLASTMPIPPTYPDPREDPVIKRILADPQLSEEEREDLVRIQLGLIEDDVRRRQAEYERLIGYQRGHRDVS